MASKEVHASFKETAMNKSQRMQSNVTHTQVEPKSSNDTNVVKGGEGMDLELL